ncbi:MAG: AAA family ATPase [Rhodospirillales bacterium]
MITSSFGFDQEPFGIDPEPRFFYLDAARQYVHAHLMSSVVDGRGLVVLTGEAGIGKTILLRHLAAELRTRCGVLSLYPDGVLSCETASSLAAVVAACRGRPGPATGGAAAIDGTDGLLDLVAGVGTGTEPAMLILDDAEYLSDDVLEQLTAFSARPKDHRGHLSIILGGCFNPPHGAARPVVEEVQRHADLVLRLQRFQDRDIEPLILHRIRAAGRDGPPLFSREAIARIARRANGNPLSINRICRSALVIAEREVSAIVAPDAVDRVAAGGSCAPREEADQGRAESPLPTAAPLPPAVAAPPPPAPADSEVKFDFPGTAPAVADKLNQIAALARTTKPLPLEDYGREERSRGRTADPLGMLLRVVWVGLTLILVAGAVGVYLLHAGRIEPVETYRDRILLALGLDDDTTPPTVVGRTAPAAEGVAATRAPAASPPAIGAPAVGAALPDRRPSDDPPAETDPAVAMRAAVAVGVDDVGGPMARQPRPATDAPAAIADPPTAFAVRPPADEPEADEPEADEPETGRPETGGPETGLGGGAAPPDRDPPAAADAAAPGPGADPVEGAADAVPQARDVSVALVAAEAIATRADREAFVAAAGSPEAFVAADEPTPAPTGAEGVGEAVVIAIDTAAGAEEAPPSPDAESPLPSVLTAEAADPDVDRMVARGDEFLALGDVASARLFYRLAVSRGSGAGATAMGSTFDPVFLRRAGVVGVPANPATAIEWYRLAMDMGHLGARIQLRDLVSHLEREEARGDPEATRLLDAVRR